MNQSLLNKVLEMPPNERVISQATAKNAGRACLVPVAFVAVISLATSMEARHFGH
jgi:hypothetical protein